MDGNGRWAKSKNKERSFGHREGAKNVRTITKQASSLGVKYLTLYAFSTENWSRPQTEVSILMKLLSEFLKTEISMLLEHNIRFEVIGNMSQFSSSLQKAIIKTKQATAHCSGMTQIIAMNYGSQDEIIRAANKIAMSNPNTLVDISLLEKHLDTAMIPPVDLLIRTGGEYRLSNFLLWQVADAELYFTPTYWPDFSAEELENIIMNPNG